MTREKLCIALMDKALLEKGGISYSCSMDQYTTVRNMRYTCYHLRKTAQALGENKFDGLKFSVTYTNREVSLLIVPKLPTDGQIRKLNDALVRSEQTEVTERSSSAD